MKQFRGSKKEVERTLVEGSRRCSTPSCRKIKPIAEFEVLDKLTGRRRHKCRTCRALQRALYRKEHPSTEYDREYARRPEVIERRSKLEMRRRRERAAYARAYRKTLWSRLRRNLRYAEGCLRACLLDRRRRGKEAEKYARRLVEIYEMMLRIERDFTRGGDPDDGP
jgi:hypothetical protein